MFKTAAIILFLILVLVLFHGDIKGWVVERQMDLTISQLEVSPAAKDRLLDIASRVGRGFADRDFTEIEKATLLELRQDLKELAQTTDEAESKKLEADTTNLIGKFEAILRRHKL